MNKFIQLTIIVLIFSCYNSIVAQVSHSSGRSISYATYAHSSETLNDGRVIMFGGDNGKFSGFKAYKSSFIYNPITNLWAQGPNMKRERSGVFSTKLNDGRIFAIGGIESDNDIATGFEIYDPISNEWTDYYTSSFPNGDCVKLLDGRVLIISGYRESAAIFNPEIDRIEFVTSMNETHGSGVDLILLESGKVLATGGSQNNQLAELYDPIKDTWTVLPQLNSERAYHNTILLNNGNVLLAGGTLRKTSEYFDVNSETFIPLPDFEIESADNPLIKLNNGKVLMYGMGAILSPTDTKCFQIYNPQSKTWSSPITNFIGTTGYSINRLKDGKIIIIGGTLTTGNGASKSVLILEEEGYESCVKPKLNLTFEGGTDCFGLDQTGIIKNTELGVNYQLLVSGRKVGEKYSGTGGDVSLNIPTNYITFGKNEFEFIASKSGCVDLTLDSTLNLTTNYGTEAIPIFHNADKRICAGDSLKISASHEEVSSFLWSDGTIDSIMYVKNEGKAFARPIDNKGCIGPKTNTVSMFNMRHSDIIIDRNLQLCGMNDTIIQLNSEPSNGVWSGENVTPEGVFTSRNLADGSQKLSYNACGISTNLYIQILNNTIPNYDINDIEWDFQDTLCGDKLIPIKFPNTSTSEKYSVYADGVLKREFEGDSRTYSFYYRTDSTADIEIFITPRTSYDICPIDTISTKKRVISVPQPDTDKDIIYPDSVCQFDSYQIKVVNPEKNVFYRYDDYNEKYCTGEDTLIFNLKKDLPYNNYYTIKAQNHKRCGYPREIEDLTIRIKKPNANFTNKDIYYVGDTVQITNTSNVNISDWTINGISSNKRDPDNRVYNQSGKNTYTLIASAQGGCSDTISKDIYVVDIPQEYKNNKGYFDTLEVKTRDGYELYQTITGKDGYIYAVGSNAKYPCGYGYTRCSNWFIEKYDSEGNNVWTREEYDRNYQHSSEYNSTFINAVDVDDEGNLYLTGSFSTNYIQIDTVLLNFTNAIRPRAFVMKLSPDNKILWFKYSYSKYSQGNGYNETGGASVKVINDVIYFGLAFMDSMKDLNGEDIGNNSQTKNRIMAFSKDGSLLKEYFVEDAISLAGVSEMTYIYNPISGSYSSQIIASVAPIITKLPNNKIAVSAITSYSDNYSTFNGIINLDNKTWQNAFSSAGGSSNSNIQKKPIVTADRDGNLIISMASEQIDDRHENYHYTVNQEKFSFEENQSTYLTSVNQSGVLKWEKILKNTIIRTTDYEETTNSLIIYGKFKKGLKFLFSDESLGIKGNDKYDNFIASFDAPSGKLKWFEKIYSDVEDVPNYAHLDDCGNYNIFGSFQHPQQNTTVHFNGDSLQIDVSKNYLIRIPIAQMDINTDCSSLITSTENPNEIDFSLLAYPNPTNGYIQLNTEEKIENIMIYNQVGQLVLKSQDHYKINLDDFPAGNYFLKVYTSQGQTLTQKIILTK